MLIYKRSIKQNYVKPANEIFARHLLATRKQQPNETDEFLQSLEILSRDCNFKNIDAITYLDEFICDSVISRLALNTIRHCLLENASTELYTNI